MPGRKNKKKQTPSGYTVKDEIASIVIFALMVYLFLCNFGIGGSVGNAPMRLSRRYRSYVETMTDLGLEIRPEWVLNCEWDDRKCMELVEEAHRLHGLPSAFYAARDLMGMAALRALYQLGIRVPDQVAVIGMSNIEMSQYANPPLTTIDVPTLEMGITAARVMAEPVHGDTTLPKRILLPSTLIERNSV